MIVIRNTNGEDVLTKAKADGLILEDECIIISDGSVKRYEIMTEDYVLLKFSLSGNVVLEIGDYIDLEECTDSPYMTRYGKYELIKPYVPAYNPTTGGYDYEVKLMADYYKLSNKIFRYRPKYGGRESAWELVAKPSVFLQLVCDNINRLRELEPNYLKGADFSWSIYSEKGVDYNSKDIYLSFSNTSIIDALTQIAQACDSNNGCEWWVEGNTIYLGRNEKYVDGEPMLFITEGVNAESVSPKESKEDVATRIYAFGSDRNLTKRYRKDLIFSPTIYASINEKAAVTEERTLTSKSGTVKYDTAGIYEPFEYSLSGELAIETRTVIRAIAAKVYLVSKTTKWCVLEINRSNVYITGRFSWQIDAKNTNFEHQSIEVEYNITTDNNAALNGRMLPNFVFDYKRGTSKYVMDSVRRMTYDMFNNAIQSDVFNKTGALTTQTQELFAKGGERSASMEVPQAIGLTDGYKGEFNYSLSGIEFTIPADADVTATIQLVCGDVRSYRKEIELTETSSHTYTSGDIEGSLICMTSGTITAIVEVNVLLKSDPTSSISGTLTINPVNVTLNTKKADITLTVLSHDYKEVKSFSAVFNPLGLHKTTEESQYIQIPEEAATLLSSNGRLYTLSNVIVGKVPTAYFTDKYAYADTYISGKAYANLMLPECPVYEKSDGTLTKTPQEGDRLVYEGNGYVDLEPNMNETQAVERIIKFDNVYPTFTDVYEAAEPPYVDTREKDENGQYTGVVLRSYRFISRKLRNLSNSDFTDNNISVQFARQIVSGQPTKVSKLEGMTFELGIYKKQDEYVTFEIIRNDDYGVTLPNDILYPENGDGYKILGFDTSVYDDSLEEEAEMELLRQTIEYAKQLKKDVSNYECKMMSDTTLKMMDRGYFYSVGDTVRLTKVSSDSRDSRIVAVEYKLDKPYDSPTLTIGKTGSYSRLGDLEQQISNMETQQSFAQSTPAGGTGGGVNIITSNSNTNPSDSNVNSAKRSDNRYLRRDIDDATEKTLGMANAVVSGDVSAETATISGKVKSNDVETRNVDADKVNTNGLSVTNLAEVGEKIVTNHLEAKGNTYLKETTFGNFTKGLIVGANTGARIYESGHADLKSLSISEFLEVPELRFNRATVEIGITIRSLGGGVIEEVRPDFNADGTKKNSGYALLKLEEGEAGAISMYDMNMGFWHNEGDGGGGVGANADENGNAKENVDKHNGDYELAGFSTVYFLIDEIPDEYFDKEKGANVKNTMSKCFHYTLRSGGDWLNTHHPHEGMHFGQIGNTNNKERQSFVITTTTYQLWLQGVNTWNYQTSNIYRIDGQLDGFAMESQRGGEVFRKEFSGNGTVLGNAYIYGGIDQFERAEIKLEITFDGDYMLAFGEEKMMSCVVTNGYGENITNQVTEWDISRDSGNVNDDKAWKNTNKVKEFLSGATGGTLILSYTKDDNDLGNSTSCLFSIVAKIGTQTAEASLSI